MATLNGRVLDAAGEPVAGATIFMVAAPVAMPDIGSLSGADGSFDLHAPAPGRYEIAAAAPDGSKARAVVEVGAGDPPRFELRLAN